MQIKICPQCGKPNPRWMEFCKECYKSLIDVPITSEEAAGNESDRTEGVYSTKHNAPDVYTGRFDNTGGTQYDLAKEEVKNQKQLPFMEPSVEPILPSICCYCGAAAEEMLDLDARQSQQRYGYKRSAIISYGNCFRIPYCPEHFPIAVMIRKKLAKLAEANNLAGWIPLVLGVVPVVLLLLFSDNLREALIALIVGGISGALLAGALLLVFEPLFAYLSGMLFPLFLESLVRADLAEHMKAQHEIYPFRILWLTYSLGFSIKYEISNASYTWKKWNAYESVCVTNAEFASSAGGIRCVRDSKLGK